MLRYCLRCLRRPADAEDALQQTFLQAHRALERGVEPAAEATWLLAIARNVCLTRSDALRRRAISEVSSETEMIADDASLSPADDDLSAEVRAALATLPSRQRDALFLREWHELSYAEIAHVLGTTEAAVETLVFRARRNLARELEPMRRRRLADLVGLLGWGRTALGSVSAKVAVGAAAATVTAGAAVTVVVERAPAPLRAPVRVPAVAVAPTASVAPHFQVRRHVVRAALPRLERGSRPAARAAAPTAWPHAPAIVEATPAGSSATPPTTSSVARTATTTPAATDTPPPTSVVSQTATTAASAVDAVGATAASVAPAAAPVTTVVSDTVDQTAGAVSQTADAAASAVNDTVATLLPGH